MSITPMSTTDTQGSLDELFEILSHPVRRRILTALARANPRDEADESFSPDDFATEDDRLDAFLTSLHHVHLPKLEETGFIRWDQETGTIIRGPRYDEIAPLVELMITHEDELPGDWP